MNYMKIAIIVISVILCAVLVIGGIVFFNMSVEQKVKDVKHEYQIKSIELTNDFNTRLYKVQTATNEIIRRLENDEIIKDSDIDIWNNNIEQLLNSTNNKSTGN